MNTGLSWDEYFLEKNILIYGKILERIIIKTF